MTELLTDPSHTRSDLRQIESAIRRGFDIPDVLYQRTAHVIGKLLNEGKAREKLAAARVVIALAEFNRSLEPVPSQVEHTHTHEIGPVTVDNLAEHKRRLLDEIGTRC